MIEMNDIYANSQQNDIEPRFFRRLFIKIIFPIVVSLFAWGFYESKFAIDNFINDHPSMMLGGLQFFVWFIFLISYFALLVFEEIWFSGLQIAYRLIGRISVIIIVYLLFFLLIRSLQFTPDDSETEFLKSFTSYYFFTIMLGVVIPAEACNLKTYFKTHFVDKRK
jgi:hypothetical protein